MSSSYKLSAFSVLPGCILENEISSNDDRLGGEIEPFCTGLLANGVLVVADMGTVDKPAAFKASCDMEPI